MKCCDYINLPYSIYRKNINMYSDREQDRCQGLTSDSRLNNVSIKSGKVASVTLMCVGTSLEYGGKCTKTTSEMWKC